MSKFVHLHTHSHYSLLDGLAKIDELINRAKELGMDALALTDHGNLYGAVEFYKKAKKAGVKPIIGIEAYLAPNGRLNKRPKIDSRTHHLILLCRNGAGWKNLIKLVTASHLEGFYYKPRIDKEILRRHSEGLIALSACMSGEVARLILENKYKEAKAAAFEYREIFGLENFFLEIGHHPNLPDYDKLKKAVIEIHKETGIPLAATQDIHYLKPEDSSYHDILLAIQTGNKINEEDRLTLKGSDFSMTSPEQMAALFENWPEAVYNTVKIADRCNLEIELGKIRLPNYPLPEGEKSSHAFLKKTVTEKLPERYPKITPELKQRLEYELETIEKTGFSDYFLIVYDFVSWAKSRGIVVGPGRGSAAGSLISYVLRITDIDPLKYNLLFERFLNPERIQMPDIDIDFADTRRDEVLAYLKQKHGEDRVAQIITFGTMAARAAVRDAGRALGLSYGFCDRLAKAIPFGSDIQTALDSADELKTLYRTDANAKKVLEAAKNLEGVARHASVHACGTVITKEPLTEHLPLQRSPQDENAVITQFEMYTIEDLGLLKVDLLGLKNLTTIEDTLRQIREVSGKKPEISEIPLDDAETFKLLQAADTTGVFQLESSGMRRYLKELKPTEFEDIVAMISLYRPGPLETGMVPKYIIRKHGKEEVKYLHPKLEPILKNTYGIGIYQEQMMQIARDLAGFTLSEADTLRKAIGKKIKSLLDEQQEKLVSGMIKNGVDEKTAGAIWELFPSFARYGFNRSHAVCYALIGYQTAYLKTHFPAEFMTALFNADIGDTERTAFLVSESKKMRLDVRPPDINASSVLFTSEEGAIRFGLLAVKNVGSAVISAIIEERSRGGPFENLTDLLGRAKHKDLNKKSLESLIKCGALDCLGIERKSALESIEEILKFAASARKSQNDAQINLFGGGPAVGSLRLKETPPAAPAEKLAWEKELLGLYVSDHPLNNRLSEIKAKGAKPIKEILQSGEAGYINVAGVVSKITRFLTKLGQPMIFAKMEDLTDAVEVLVFHDTLSKNPDLWKENNVLMVKGRMSQKNGELKMLAKEAWQL